MRFLRWLGYVACAGLGYLLLGIGLLFLIIAVKVETTFMLAVIAASLLALLGLWMAKVGGAGIGHKHARPE